ncbi:hypothetical protein ACIBTV_17355 [Micromonospora sp. NPDC049366]|uniref:hypothetical protein n=1 Tax=Micromonospora sp. NPDC049366 TaxID=3364271 RepID=UPI0037A2C720
MNDDESLRRYGPQPSIADLPHIREILRVGSEDTADALHYLVECEAAGDFDTFSVAEQARWRADYYLG